VTCIRHREGVAVGIRFRCNLHGEVAACPGAIVDEDLFAERLSQASSEDAS
jgi:hypothetical protein